MSAVSSNQRVLSGTVIFSDDEMPNVEMKVLAYVQGQLWGRTYVGEGKTDTSGRYQISYTWPTKLMELHHNIELELVEKRRPFAQQGLMISEPVVLQLFRTSFNANEKEMIFDCEATYADIPDDLTVVNPPPASHKQSSVYEAKFAKASFLEAAKKAVVYASTRFISLERVQQIYDSFGLKYIDHQQHPLTPENLIEELLNQICSVDYIKQDNTVTWTADWTNCSRDIAQSLPNVTVIAELEGDNLTLQKIEIKFEEDANSRQIIPSRSDSEQLRWAIFVARSVFALKGEAETHLAEGHLLPGVIAKSFFKYVKENNPIFSPVAPHISELDHINWLGSKGIIFGKGSVLESSALTARGVSYVILRHLKEKVNFRTDLPQEPLCKRHIKAYTSQVHYNLLLKFFTDFIKDNLRAIEKEKMQIYNWISAARAKLPLIPEDFIDKSPQLEPKEQEDLAQFLTWLVHKTTFVHWAAHSQQQLLTDVRCTSLAMRHFGLTPDGKLAFGGNSRPAEANIQLFISRTLLNFPMARLLDNPYGDVDQQLIALIKANKEAYQMNVQEMNLTTQI